METRGKTVMRVLVPRGDDPPYAVDDNKIYVRDEAESGLAVRDEIVSLVKRSRRTVPEAAAEVKAKESGGIEPPKTGVEIAEVEERNGTKYYTMRDLRNGNTVKNVTKRSARRLWHYAISEFTKLPGDLKQASIAWQGDLGIIKKQKRGNRMRFDLAQKTPDRVRVYFGVTEDGIHSDWKQLVGAEAD